MESRKTDTSPSIEKLEEEYLKLNKHTAKEASNLKSAQRSGMVAKPECALRSGTITKPECRTKK